MDTFMKRRRVRLRSKTEFSTDMVEGEEGHQNNSDLRRAIESPGPAAIMQREMVNNKHRGNYDGRVQGILQRQKTMIAGYQNTARNALVP